MEHLQVEHPQSNQPTDYDLIIVGGGMVGATAAIALARVGLKIAVIEATPPSMVHSPAFDQRAVALSASSVAIYQSLGLWQLFSTQSCPIEQVLVSDQGNCGFTRIKASDYHQQALGEVIALETAGPLLWQAVLSEDNIHSYCPEKVLSIDLSNSDYCQVTTNKNQLNAKLLLAADGTFSQIAQLANLEITRQPYAQHALIANIETEYPHLNRAFERFTPNGPLALLPLTDNRLSLVWCQKADKVDSIMALSETEKCILLQQEFGYRLGKIKKIGEVTQYPLSLHLAKQCFTRRILLLGNSAHTVHPIAGQGLNLGLRDIAALTDAIQSAIKRAEEFSTDQFLASFVESRQADWQQTLLATDSLARLFSNQFLPLVFARNQAMNLVNRLPFVKHQLAKAAMGYGGWNSSLARGITLAKPNNKPPLNFRGKYGKA